MMLGINLEPKIGYVLVIFGVMFWISFWTTFGAVFGAMLGLLLWLKRSQKVDMFLERLLLALWRHFGRFLGCLGALLGFLLGGQVVQYKTTIFKIASLRYRSSLGWLLEAMLAHFGEILDLKWRPKTLKHWSKK